MQVQYSKTSGSRNLVSGFLCLFVFSLLTAAFSFTPLHAQTRAYIANINSNTVSVIDTTTNTLTATIPVGSGPSGLVASPDGTTVYVSNFNDGTISVINTASNTVTGVFNTTGNPGFSAISPDGKTLYVPNGNGGLDVVDTASKSIITTVVGLGDASAFAVITPDGGHVYVNGVEGVFVIATATNTVVASSIAPNGFTNFQRCLAITPDGSQVYLLGNITVVAISTATNTVSATLTLPESFLQTVAISPDSSKAYVSDVNSQSIFIIDTATNTLEATSIPVSNFPFALAVTPDGAFIYATKFNGVAFDAVSAISTATNTEVATVPLGSFPFDIAITNLNAPFASFPAPTPASSGNPNRIALSGSLSLGANSQGLDFAHQPMTLTVGGFSLLFPAGTVTQVGNSSKQHFTFSGTLNGLSVIFDLIGNSPNFSYSVTIQGKNVGTQVGPNPVTISLAIGNNSGSSTVNF